MILFVVRAPTGPLRWTRSGTEEGAWEAFAPEWTDVFRMLAEEQGYEVVRYTPLPNERQER